MKVAAQAVDRGDYGTALAEYTKCIDRSLNLKHDSKYLRVVARRMVELGNKHPQSVQILRSRRDIVEENAAKGIAKAVATAFILNVELQEPHRNIRVCLSIPAHTPERERFYLSLLPELAKAREYSAIVAAVNLENAVFAALQGTVKRRQGETLDLQGSETGVGGSSARAKAWALAAVESYLATGNPRSAEKLAALALTINPGSEMQEAFIAAANRSKADSAPAFVRWVCEHFPHGIRKSGADPLSAVRKPRKKTIDSN